MSNPVLPADTYIYIYIVQCISILSTVRLCGVVKIKIIKNKIVASSEQFPFLVSTFIVFRENQGENKNFISAVKRECFFSIKLRQNLQ